MRWTYDLPTYVDGACPDPASLLLRWITLSNIGEEERSNKTKSHTLSGHLDLDQQT
jgi:hypothetical protein